MRRALILAWLAAGSGCVGNPGAAQQTLMQGDMRLVHKDYEGALGLYSQAINDDPYLRDAYLHRGVAYRGLGDFEHALADIDHALQLDPTFGRAYTERVRAKLVLI